MPPDAQVADHFANAEVQRHAVRLRFTWCMGGITFLLFLVTVLAHGARRLFPPY